MKNNLSYNKDDLLYNGKDHIKDMLLTKQSQLLCILVRKNKGQKRCEVNVRDLGAEILGSDNYVHHALEMLNKANLISINKTSNAQVFVEITDEGKRIAENIEKAI